ncbi:MAG: hypothetical protein ACE5E1_11170, partial [Phycisphaerae bacterium]
MYRRNPAAHRQPAARHLDRKTARLSGLSIAVLLLTWAVVTPASAQQSEDGARSDGRQDVREGDREDREARRARWRQRWQQYRDATPEQRRQMRVDRWVERAARTYELDEAQKEQVRVEIEAIQRERREAMGADAEEYER